MTKMASNAGKLIWSTFRPVYLNTEIYELVLSVGWWERLEGAVWPGESRPPAVHPYKTVHLLQKRSCRWKTIGGRWDSEAWQLNDICCPLKVFKGKFCAHTQNYLEAPVGFLMFCTLRSESHNLKQTKIDGQKRHCKPWREISHIADS